MAGATPFLSHCALRAGSLTRGLAWPPVPRAVAGRILTWLIWGIGLSAAAQIASLPIVLDTFGRMNPGFALNLIWLPVQAMVVLPAAWIGMLLQAAGCEAVAAAPLHLAAGVCSGLLHLLDILDAHGMLEPVSAIRPHWTAGIGYGALVVSLALSAGASGAARRLAGAGAALVLVAIGLRLYDEAAARTRLRLLDVGQGQAVLLEWRGGRGLVDAGGFAVGTLDSGKDIVAPVLTAGRAPRLNFAAASHMDHDHAGGLPFLLEAFDIPLFFSSAQTDSGIRPEERARSASPPARPHRSGVDDVLVRKRIRKESPASGDRIILAPDLWLEALWPPPGRVLRANDSLVLRLVRETGGVRRGLAVLCGDLPRREQRGLLKLHAGRDITAQILVLPHHGSQRDLEPELYDVLKPSLALAATGAGNRWGFPSVRVREVLAQKGIPLLTTADYGELAIEFRADGLADVRPARPVQTPAP
jgi:competence protein ComEC